MMGKASGQSKARTKEQAQAAGRARWRPKKKDPAEVQKHEQDFSELRALAGVRQPKRNKS